MVHTHALALAPSPDSATITPQIYPEGRLRCTAPVFEPGGGGINVARAIVHPGGSVTTILPADDATGEHLILLLADGNAPVAAVEAKNWTRQNSHVHARMSGKQHCFVMLDAVLNKDEFRQLEEQVLEIESGAILVISGGLPPGAELEKLTQLTSTAQKQGTRCIVGSSGGTLNAALAVGNIELIKPNRKELSVLVSRELTQSGDVRKAAQEIVGSDKTKRVVVSLDPQGALSVDSEDCIQVVPPPAKSQSTIGAGDNIIGAMALKLTENAPPEEIVRLDVAARNAAAPNQGTRLCSHDDTQKTYVRLSR